MSLRIGIDVDRNQMDDTGLPWTFVSEAADPNKIVPNAYVIAGRGTAVAVADVVEFVDGSDVVLVDAWPGAVACRGRSRRRT